MRQNTKSAQKIQTLERALLAVFLFSRAWMLVTQWGLGKGFDVQVHLDMVRRITWATSGSIDMHSVFYGYHPPMAFLFARVPLFFGIGEIASVQIISAIASLLAFFCLRETLKVLGLLDDLRAMVVLYVASSLPLQIFLSHGINMDVLVLAFSSAVLYFSTGLVTHARSPMESLLWGSGVAFSIYLAFMTKFTAVLLLPIPVVVALLLGGRMTMIRRLGMVSASVAVAVLMAFPYYYGRYYVPEGTFFPSNTDTFDAPQQADARARRDENPTAFVASLFLHSSAVASEPEIRDLQILRFADTWKDVFVQDAWIGPQPRVAKWLTGRYLAAATLLVPIGLMAFLWKARKKPSSLERFGMLLLAIGALHVLFIVCYAYRNPWAGALPMKAIYIAPFTWAIALALVYPLAHVRLPFVKRVPETAASLTALFVLINHLLVLY